MTNAPMIALHSDDAIIGKLFKDGQDTYALLWSAADRRSFGEMLD